MPSKHQVGSSILPRVNMVEIEKLPLKIGSYERESLQSHSFLDRGAAKGYTISKDGTHLIHGSWRPVGAILKKIPIQNNEDILSEILK